MKDHCFFSPKFNETQAKYGAPKKSSRIALYDVEFRYVRGVHNKADWTSRFAEEEVLAIEAEKIEEWREDTVQEGLEKEKLLRNYKRPRMQVRRTLWFVETGSEFVIFKKVREAYGSIDRKC